MAAFATAQFSMEHQPNAFTHTSSEPSGFSISNRSSEQAVPCGIVMVVQRIGVGRRCVYREGKEKTGCRELQLLALLGCCAEFAILQGVPSASLQLLHLQVIFRSLTVCKHAVAYLLPTSQMGLQCMPVLAYLKCMHAANKSYRPSVYAMYPSMDTNHLTTRTRAGADFPSVYVALSAYRLRTTWVVLLKASLKPSGLIVPNPERVERKQLIICVGASQERPQLFSATPLFIVIGSQSV